MDIDGNEVMAKDLKGKKLMPFENYKRDLSQISDYIMFGFIQRMDVQIRFMTTILNL